MSELAGHKSILLSNINFCLIRSLFRAFLNDHYLFLEMINVLNILAQNHKRLHVLVRWDEVFLLNPNGRNFFVLFHLQITKKIYIQSSIWYCEEREFLSFQFIEGLFLLWVWLQLIIHHLYLILTTHWGIYEMLSSLTKWNV